MARGRKQSPERWQTPVWDQRLIELAKHVASWSKDPSTKVGAVVCGLEKTQIAIGYNGFPPRIADDERLNQREKKYPLIVHAEENALANALFDVRGGTIYATHFPCKSCCRTIIARGIHCVVAPKPNADYLSRWGEDVKAATEMFEEARVTLVTI